MIAKQAKDNDSLNSFVDRSYNYAATSVNKDSLNKLFDNLNIIDPEKLSKEDLSIIFQRIDDYEGLFTTQQLENIDYSEFKNHIVFDSAVSKVSYAFEQIQNVPYDKNQVENIKFFNRMDGYTNYLLKNVYPTSTGYAKFNQNDIVVVYDEQGKILNDTKNRNRNILNPVEKSFSFDFWIKPELTATNTIIDYQTVFSKINVYTENAEDKVDNGFICYITKNGVETSTCFLNFSIYINKNFINKKILINTEVFQNINISITQRKAISFVVNGNIVSEIFDDHANQNLNSNQFSNSFNNKAPFSLGKIFVLDNESIITSVLHDGQNMNGFVGSIDEFRFFHKIRSYKTIKKEMNSNIFSQRGLKLYLRLNEPGGDYTNSCLCIDYSGNKLHGVFYEINNNVLNIKSDTSLNKVNENTPLVLENKSDSPVLNSAYTITTQLRDQLINLAKKYDANNPSLIFNLMPKHYFLNSSEIQNLPVYSNDEAYNLPSEIAILNNNISNKSNLNLPVPANNDLVNIVLIWARFFDKLKLYISSITNLLNVDYDAINNKKIISMQIPILCKMYGIKFKEILSSPSKEKLNNKNLNYEDILSDLSIRKIQNLLWQRFLINTQDFLKSKGTINSIHSAFNSFGIESKKLINIREYSTFNHIKESQNFIIKNIKKNYVNFGNNVNLMTNDESFALDKNIGQTNNYNIPNSQLLLIIDNIRSKSLDQSKSNSTQNTLEAGVGDNWSVELFFNFKDIINKKNALHKTKLNQKFLSMTGKNYNKKQTLLSIKDFILVEYVENDPNLFKGDITVYIQPKSNALSNDTVYKIILENVDLFNCEKYFVLTQSRDGSSNTYYASLIDLGNKNILNNESIFEKSLSIDIQNNLNDIQNIKIGKGSYKSSENTNVDFYSENDSSLIHGEFEGEIYNIRLWKKNLSKSEIVSHSNDIENIGTSTYNPLKHLIFDFCVKDDERFRLDNEGSYYWKLEDNSNNLIKFNSNFVNLNACNVYNYLGNQLSNNIIQTNVLSLKKKSMKIDESAKSNKFNIVSFSEDENKNQENNFNIFPAHEVPNEYVYDTANRVSIDMSITKAINDDIENIISDLNDFNIKIKSFSNKFEYQYKFIDNLREEYFSKFSDRVLINYASLGNVFKYFDNIMSSVLFDIVPSNVSFEGFNFVYESHILERHKYEHKNKDSINTIVSQEDQYDFSRKNLYSRRSNSYNLDRQ